MPKANVSLRITYYRCLSENGDARYDLSPILTIINNSPLGNREITIRGIKGRLEKLKAVDDFPHLYAFCFMRMDNMSDAYRVKAYQEAEHLDLEEDEYLGTSTFGVYDAARSALVIQTNRGGLSSGLMQCYFNEFAEERCWFQPLVNTEDMKLLIDSSASRAIEITLCDVSAAYVTKSKEFEGIVQSAHQLGGKTCTLRVSVGRERNRQLNRVSLSTFLSDLFENAAYVSNAKISLKRNNGQANQEDLNLFTPLIRDVVSVPVNIGKEINFDEAVKAIAKCYTDRMVSLGM